MARRIGTREVLEFLESHREERFLITFHSMGDRDSVGSAVALKEYLTNSLIATPDFITSTSKRMLAQLSGKVEIGNKIPQDIYGIIITDANNSEALGSFGPKIAKSKKPVLFIDHHLESTSAGQNMMVFNDEGYNSTASLVYGLLRELQPSISSDQAIALLSGIIADSFEFHNMYPQTFRQISELLKYAKVEYPDFMAQFAEKVPAYNRKQSIADVCAAHTEIIGDYLLMYGRATIHANISAETAINIGADAALFWHSSSEEVSLSTRLKSPLDRKLSIHLGKIMREVGPILGGNGGGHPAAAGAYGPNKRMAQKAIDKILKELRDKLSQ
ncbi:MAG: DHH family phosphoesterase [Candidatus Micrarchaeota archaeon]|nr:DHH family phosphoesterase [Candidatus Micrarchaeota archaeon]